MMCQVAPLVLVSVILLIILYYSVLLRLEGPKARSPLFCSGRICLLHPDDALLEMLEVFHEL